MTDHTAYRGRLLFEGTLKLMSPLHIGAGFSDGVQGLDADGNTVGEAASIVFGKDGKPVIPPTSLKGAMRALVVAAADGPKDGHDPEIACKMFGEVRGGTGGTQGVVTPLTAMFMSAGSETRVEDVGARGDYRTTRTAIDGASGVPRSGLLFSKTVVGADATFGFRMMVTGDPDKIDGEVAGWLARLLRTMQADDKDNGLRLGAGRADGQGVVTLTINTVRAWRLVGATLQESDVTRLWLDRISGAAVLRADKRSFALTLAGDGPFMVLGHEKETAPIDGDVERKNIRKALRRGNTKAELPGTSLMGALRARAEWCVALADVRKWDFPFRDEHILAKMTDAAIPSPKLLIAELFGADDAALDCNATRKALAARAGITERQLTGFAGMLRVASIAPRPARLKTLTSVKIDRFTQGPMDRALFTSEAFVNPVFDVKLVLDHRAKDIHALFVEGLLADMTADGPRSGLMLGHGAARGFGWMRVAAVGGGDGTDA